MEIIESLTNTKVKYWMKLKQKKYRDLEELFMIEGYHLVNEALKNNLIKEIIVKEGNTNKYNADMYYVTKEIMTKLSDVESVSEVIGVCYKKKEVEVGNKIIMLDALQDPGNLGCIIRSAVAFNFDTIALGDGTVDLYNEKVIRSTEGMLFNINIIKKDLKTFILELKKKNYRIYGTKQNGSTPKRVITPQNFGVIIGNEGTGISRDIIALCDENIFIPISDKCESLNAAVAASIIMYEMSMDHE